MKHKLKRKLVSQGARGLVHGNRGRPSPRALNGAIAQRIIALSREKCANFNDTHFTEKLKEAEGIIVGRNTVRRPRRNYGIVSNKNAEHENTTSAELASPKRG